MLCYLCISALTSPYLRPQSDWLRLLDTSSSTEKPHTGHLGLFNKMAGPVPGEMGISGQQLPLGVHVPSATCVLLTDS